MTPPRTQAELLKVALPWPLFPTLVDALSSGDHGRIVDAWEGVLRVPTAAVWGVARARGVRSDRFDAMSAALIKPGMGSWLDLLDEGSRLLSTLPEEDQGGLAPLLKMLAAKLQMLEGAEAFQRDVIEHTRSLFPREKWRAVTVLDALRLAVVWRNASVGLPP